MVFTGQTCTDRPASAASLLGEALDAVDCRSALTPPCTCCSQDPP